VTAIPAVHVGGRPPAPPIAPMPAFLLDRSTNPACGPDTAELFYPGWGGSTRPAKALCGSCPVRNPCLQWAVDNRERWGVWGGRHFERKTRKQEAAA
jgi:hypothetical protein